MTAEPRDVVNKGGLIQDPQPAHCLKLPTSGCRCVLRSPSTSDKMRMKPKDLRHAYFMAIPPKKKGTMP